MKKLFIILVLFISCFNATAGNGQDSRYPVHADSIPQFCKGTFTDDYGIRYQVSDSLWIQFPGVKYHILTWNTAGQYIIARNDDGNPSEKGLYTRIDYMAFSNMEPYRWGFCLTVYDAPDAVTAENRAKADRGNPKKGCNGYPFSRMKSAAD